MDETYMRRALALAEKGRGFVSPNPLVGAVLVKDGRVIGEGWHQKAGGPTRRYMLCGLRQNPCGELPPM